MMTGVNTGTAEEYLWDEARIAREAADAKANALITTMSVLSASWEQEELIRLVEAEVISGDPYPQGSKKAGFIARRLPSKEERIAFFKRTSFKDWKRALRHIALAPKKCPKGEDPNIWKLRRRLERHLYIQANRAPSRHPWRDLKEETAREWRAFQCQYFHKVAGLLLGGRGARK